MVKKCLIQGSPGSTADKWFISFTFITFACAVEPFKLSLPGFYEVILLNFFIGKQSQIFSKAAGNY